MPRVLQLIPVSAIAAGYSIIERFLDNQRALSSSSATFCDLRAGICNLLGFKRRVKFGRRYKTTVGGSTSE